MSLPVLVLRPEPGLTATLVAAFDKGIRARGMPLVSVEPVAWSAPATAFDGLLIGSANAIRHAGAELEKVAHLPVFAVGETTAQTAREAGLTVEQVGRGGLQSLLDVLGSTPRPLLRLAGETHLELQAGPDVQIETEIVYRAVYHPISAAQAQVLAHDCVVLFHSGEMARHFMLECERLAVDKCKIAAAAMAPRISEMAGTGWKSLHVARDPSDASLLDLAAQLCQDP